MDKDNLFVVYDKKGSYYLDPIFSIRRGILTRKLIDVINQPSTSDHPFAKNPGDFSLHTVGHFNQDSGEITPKRPEFIMDLIDLKSHES